MIAYGPELNLAYPPKPADPKAPWNPEWAARVRVKSTGTTLLGADSGGGPGSTSAGEDAKPSSPLKLLKGLFGG